MAQPFEDQRSPNHEWTDAVFDLNRQPDGRHHEGLGGIRWNPDGYELFGVYAAFQTSGQHRVMHKHTFGPCSKDTQRFQTWTDREGPRSNPCAALGAQCVPKQTAARPASR